MRFLEHVEKVIVVRCHDGTALFLDDDVILPAVEVFCNLIVSYS